MMKSVKSILIWGTIYKFRKRLSLVVMLLSFIVLSQWIYGDVVEYLTLTNATHYLHYILPIKWALIFFNITLLTYLVLTLFKVKDAKSKPTNVKPEKKIDKDDSIKKSLSQREQSFLHKKLRTRAEILKDRD